MTTGNPQKIVGIEWEHKDPGKYSFRSMFLLYSWGSLFWGFPTLDLRLSELQAEPRVKEDKCMPYVGSCPHPLTVCIRDHIKGHVDTLYPAVSEWGQFASLSYRNRGLDNYKHYAPRFRDNGESDGQENGNCGYRVSTGDNCQKYVLRGVLAASLNEINLAKQEMIMWFRRRSGHCDIIKA